ncbi:type II toxin-antitoxin system RelE/ParE family toxin [Asticcacaulis sp. YBE204]|uniref:type II toxin-antitoxin system RelE/ParE family toxin n=1 Tax=Asticcacaulis sp. YBE204 TaxID=1282363 RepID=UPI0004CF5969|nr:type II toxin-antitoxin system RelE/ParE family toxin [Asticcacaulis sp. YBE204]
MRIRWLSSSQRDLSRLHDFLKDAAPDTASRRIRAIIAAVERLIEFPNIAPRVERYGSREVRALLVGDYELHYEVMADTIVILRIWHVRENR